MDDNQPNGSDAGQTPAPDKASAKLQKQLDAFAAEIEKYKRSVSELTTDRDTLATANGKLQQQLDEKAEELAEAQELIEQQTSQLKAAEVSQAEGPVVVSHEKEQYRVLAPKFSHKGLDVDAATLRNNPDLVRELVEAGSGLLQKVEAA